MEVFQILSALGLLFDIIGASILFRFGIPPKEAMEQYWESPGNEPEKTYRDISQYGFMLLIFGFILQFVSTLINLLT